MNKYILWFGAIVCYVTGAIFQDSSQTAAGAVLTWMATASSAGKDE